MRPSFTSRVLSSLLLLAAVMMLLAYVYSRMVLEKKA